MPIALVGLPPITDEALERIGRANDGWAFERDDAGDLVARPTHTRGGSRNAAALAQLMAWASTTGNGTVFESSTGFKLKSGAIRSPDASWVSNARIAALQATERVGFWPLCPDVVVEIASDSDRWSDVVAKIEMYARNGATFAIGIDPESRTVFSLGEAPAGLRFDIDAICEG